MCGDDGLRLGRCIQEVCKEGDSQEHHNFFSLKPPFLLSQGLYSTCITAQLSVNRDKYWMNMIEKDKTPSLFIFRCRQVIIKPTLGKAHPTANLCILNMQAVLTDSLSKERNYPQTRGARSIWHHAINKH